MIGVKTSLLFFTVLILASVILAGCGGLQRKVELSPEKTEKVVKMNASSFSFEPNDIKAYVGDTLIFRIETFSGKDHNFTITGPDGESITGVDLPVRETTDVRVTLKTSGPYTFYCNKSYHASHGMKGQVVAVEK
jgi:plastocyanin